MSQSEYTYAGVTTGKDGVQRVCYANSAGRVKVLLRNGHTDPRLVQVCAEGSTEPTGGSRLDCMNYLLSLPEFKEIPCVLAEARELGFKV